MPKGKKKPLVRTPPKRRLNRNVQAVAQMSRSPGLQMAVRRNARMSQNGPMHLLRCMNANYPNHLSLPRAIGPYSITRSTKIVLAPDGVTVFGTMMEKTTGYWSNVCAVRPGVASNGAINGVGNCKLITMPGIDSTTLGIATTLVPSAMTIQLMNPEALNKTEGIVYAGVMNQVPQMGDDGQNWVDFAESFVSFNKPRLLSAGKICLSGAEASLIPMNMEALAHFSPLASYSDGEILTWDLASALAPLKSYDSDFAGFAPLVVYNPSNIDLQYLVTIEYRLRFDITHPASSTHTFHQPASLASWSSVIKHMCALGNGVKDIADVVATGASAYGSVRAAQLALH